jgi:hypothetical protein
MRGDIWCPPNGGSSESARNHSRDLCIGDIEGNAQRESLAEHHRVQEEVVDFRYQPEDEGGNDVCI